MKKSPIIILLISLSLFYNPPFAFSQGREYERVRAVSIPAGEKPLIGEEGIAEYYVAAGDTIEVFVWRNPDLTRDVTIRPDGKISYPLIGTVKAAGLTIDQLQNKIEEELSKYVRSPTEYRIEPGDEIEIFVWKNADLTRTVTVRGNGKITYPLIGTIQVAGLTIEEIQDKIKKELVKHVTAPKIEYRIESGDVIEIFVWQDPDLTREVTVRPDGKIAYPLIGTVKAAGLTIDEFQDKAKEKFSQYIKFPDVTVSVRKLEKDIFEVKDVIVSIKKFSENKITLLGDIIVSVKEFAGNKIIILGAINYPGIYPYKGTINLLEAIALAGDISNEGKKESVIVVSDNLTEHPKVRRVNVFRAMRKGTSKQDIILKPNDLVYIPRRFISDFNRFLADIQPSVERAFDVFSLRDELRAWYHHGSTN